LQEYGAVRPDGGGRVEWTSLAALPCGGADIHGWVTGRNAHRNVEVFLDGGSLGSATLFGPPRLDVVSTTPVQSWRISVKPRQHTRGDHTLAHRGQDINGNRRQFAAQRVFQWTGQQLLHPPERLMIARPHRAAWRHP